MRGEWRILVGLVFLGTLLVGCVSSNKRSGLPESVAVGKPAPEIEGDDTDGKPFKLSDQRGKVVLLDFWGDW